MSHEIEKIRDDFAFHLERERNLSVHTVRAYLGDLDSFFRHENQNFPPSLSKFGSLRMGKKSQLLPMLEDLAPVRQEPPAVDVLLLDGAAIINILKPGAA